MKKLIIINMLICSTILAADVPIPIGNITQSTSPSNSDFILGVKSGVAKLFSLNSVGSLLVITNNIIYTNTGIYCDINITNNSYVVSGATGSYTNSSGTSLSFLTANGTYVWNGSVVGRSFDSTAPTGVFINTNSPAWFLSYQYWGFAAPTWIIYNTNTWLTSTYPTTTNVVLAGGLTISPASDYNIYLPNMRSSNYWQFMPGAITSSITIVPLFFTNTVLITNSNFDVVESLLHFPKIGPTQTSVRRGNTFAPNNGYPPEPGILHISSGSGVVRGIEIMPGQWSPITYRSNFWLQIFPDYGNNSTTYSLVNSNYMTFNVPLQSLVPCKWNATNIANNMPTNGWSTAYTDVATDGSTPFMKISLNTPFPYTNGVFIRVIDTALNSEWAAATSFSTVNYETDQLNMLNNYPAFNYRLHGVLSRTDSSGAILTNPNQAGVTDWTKMQQTMINITNCSGTILGVWAGLAGVSSGGFETADWIWITDGKYPCTQMEGEDIFFTPFEFTAAGPRFNYTHGVVTRSAPFAAAPGTFDAYREFTTGFQISWKDSIKGFLTPGSSIWGDIVTIYYSSK